VGTGQNLRSGHSATLSLLDSFPISVSLTKALKVSNLVKGVTDLKKRTPRLLPIFSHPDLLVASRDEAIATPLRTLDLLHLPPQSTGQPRQCDEFDWWDQVVAAIKKRLSENGDVGPPPSESMLFDP
jgi:hypothetical protein